MIKYFCSNGDRVSQATIDKRRSQAYREKYSEYEPKCEEEGVRAQCSSHIVSQARCKQLHKTELIWDKRNFYPATYVANSRWEANDKTLKNYWKYMEVLKKLDPEGYNKRLWFVETATHQ